MGILIGFFVMISFLTYIILKRENNERLDDITKLNNIKKNQKINKKMRATKKAKKLATAIGAIHSINNRIKSLEEDIRRLKKEIKENITPFIKAEQLEGVLDKCKKELEVWNYLAQTTNKVFTINEIKLLEKEFKNGSMNEKIQMSEPLSVEEFESKIDQIKEHINNNL